MFLFFMNQCNGLSKAKYSCKGARFKKWVNSCRVLSVVGMCLLIYCKLFDWSIVCYVDIQVSSSCIDGCKVFQENSPALYFRRYLSLPVVIFP